MKRTLRTRANNKHS